MTPVNHDSVTDVSPKDAAQIPTNHTKWYHLERESQFPGIHPALNTFTCNASSTVRDVTALSVPYASPLVLIEGMIMGLDFRTFCKMECL